MKDKITERITVNSEILAGKPIIRGTRISVELVLELLASGMSVEDILEGYPHLKKEDILAALEYAAKRLNREEIYLTA